MLKHDAKINDGYKFLDTIGRGFAFWILNITTSSDHNFPINRD